MSGTEDQPRTIRFGAYELDEATHELRKNGLRIHLQDQPWEVLCALLERPGEVVAREELRRRLWPDGTFVDYEKGLNKAVNKLREALCDSADNPRYVQTTSRRGYRFVAPVEGVRMVAPIARAPEPAVPAAPPPRSRALPWLVAGGCVLAIVLGTGLWPIDVPRVEKVLQLTNDTTLKEAGPFICDGSRVIFCDRTGAWWVPASGGETKRFQLPFLHPDAYFHLVGYAPVRRQILVESSEGWWLVGAEGEEPHKIGGLKSEEGDYGQIAITPDAERLAFVAPDGIYVQSVVSGARKKVHPALTSWTPLVWRPSGRAIGFTLPSGDTWDSFHPWLVDDDGTHLRRIVPERGDTGWVGPWSQDERRYFYIPAGGEIYVRIQPGILGWLRRPVITRLTDSQYTSNAPVLDPVNPKRLYAVGGLKRGQTERYDLKAHRWVPFLSGFSGEMIERSPDGQSMAYVPFPGFELHKCAIDGSADILLTPGVRVANPHWSPNGKRIVFAGHPADKIGGGNGLWLVSSGGGDAAPYRPEIAPITDAHWSPDGKRLLIGFDPNGAPPRERVRILDLETGKLEPLPGSEKLWSPRWSPDGKRIMALAADEKLLPNLFDAEKRVWRPLGKQHIGWNEWSRDGKFIYGMWFPHGKIEAYRIEVTTGRSELVERTDFNINGNANWVGWTWEGEPLTIRDLSSTQIYRIDLDR